MKLLALDTCLGACSAAVLEEGQVRAHRFELMTRGHAEVIAPMVQAVMADAGFSMNSLERIAVTVGPGSFTGVRIGLSLAQGLGIGCGIPVTGLSTMLATAAPVLGHQAVLVCHAAGASGQYYVQHFNAKGAAETDILLQKPQDIVLAENELAIGTGAAIFVDGRRDGALDLPDAKRFAALAGSLTPGDMPQPLYIREPDAKPQVAGTVAAPDVAVAGPELSDVLSRLHAACFAEPWPASDIAAMFETGGTLAFIASSAHGPSGFVLARAIAGEAEILTLCTQPASRRRGVGQALLRSLVERLRAAKVHDLHLEVAADNQTAIDLYEHFGFRQSGRRKAYYRRRDGTCDALMYRLSLT